MTLPVGYHYPLGSRIDLSGQRFGLLLVKEALKVDRRKTIWTCICDCGKVVEVSTGDLRSGNTSSCGCRGHNRIGAKQAEQNLWLHSLKKGAQIRGLSVEMDDQELLRIAQAPCAYCGHPAPRYTGARKRNKHHAMKRGYEFCAEYYDSDPLFIQGIDRIDSCLSYVPGNCVACCAVCNQMKNAHSLPFWILKMREILMHIERESEKEIT